MRAKLLVGELDLNGLIGAFELYSLRHRLVSRACAPRLFVFIHKNNQLTNGGASPTALLRLREAGKPKRHTRPPAAISFCLPPGGASGKIFRLDERLAPVCVLESVVRTKAGRAGLLKLSRDRRSLHDGNLPRSVSPRSRSSERPLHQS